MRRLARLAALVLPFGPHSRAISPTQPPPSSEAPQITANQVSGHGGSPAVAQDAEPKTSPPVTGDDVRSREVMGRMRFGPIDSNRDAQKTEPSLAKPWITSHDGRVLTLQAAGAKW